jgi:hypothetical protein
MIQIYISSTILKQSSFAKRWGGRNFNIFEKERYKLTPRINHKEIFFSLVIRIFYSNIRKDDPTFIIHIQGIHRRNLENVEDKLLWY